MFERFTRRARRVVVLAQEEARLLDHGYVGTEHILLGLIHDGDGVAARAMASAGVTLDSARARVEEIVGRGGATPSGHIPLTPRAKTVLELSLREALELKKNYIGTEHILLGLIREGHGVGAQVLERLGGPLPAIRASVTELAETGQPGSAPEDLEDPDDPAARVRLWPPGWPPSVADWGRGPRIGIETVGEFRTLLSSIDRRLAAIERHLGIAGEPVTPPDARAD